MGCHVYNEVDCRREWRLRCQDLGGQCEYRKRHEGSEVEEQGFLRRRPGSGNQASLDENCSTGPNTFDILGTFTIRDESKPETLHRSLSGKRTGHGEVTGTMAFDRKDFGMNSGIPFIKIADRVEVNVDLIAERISGPPIVYKE